MTSEQIAALIAAVPSVAALVWVIVRQQTQLERLTDALLRTQQTLLALHPPQQKDDAKNISGEGS